MDTPLLAADFRELIRPHTGDLTRVRPTAGGHSSDVATVVECEKGPFFVKAVPNRPGGRRDSIVRERLINPAVRSVSPALRWHAENDVWVVLGFDAVEGRAADFSPGSPDLPTVVGLVDRIGELDLPEVAREWPETRWDRFAGDEGQAALLRGDDLLHTDINPGNMMIGEHTAWAVDWSWPTRGAGFIDPACLVVQLIAAGHSPESAESWASGCAAWADADPKAVDAFARANALMYRVFADRKPDASWLGAMADASRAWADHRGVST
ncbi:protein kinase [Streptomyces sp. S1A]|uniref:Protein kinase n=1 Tax=Streptomyces chitinivorans TaxID=1257027 RepID=A0ABW7HUC2_9ACTN|nr:MULTISPECIES: protein kinase [Streptomyces]MCG3042013.1 protein kinase [Streptomyces sp. ICN903]MDH2408282.1 protein kinase [Streptomyces chitinivorans]